MRPAAETLSGGTYDHTRVGDRRSYRDQRFSSTKNTMNRRIQATYAYSVRRL
jgi:hypothetical protein